MVGETTRGEDVTRSPSTSVSAPTRVAAGSTVAAVVCKLPVFLAGGLAVFVRPDVGLSLGTFGLSVAAFFAATAAASVPGGAISDRMGPRLVLRTAVATAAVGMLLLGLAGVWWQVSLLLVVTGAANGLVEPAANLAIARGVTGDRQGFFFAIKQVAAPITTLVAGSSVPLLGLTVGWRWAYGLAGILSIAVLPLIPADGAAVEAGPPGRYRHGSPVPALLVLAVGFGFGAACGTALATFFVDAATTAGIEVGRAGVLLAVGSAAAIVVRLVVGWAADRRLRRHLAVVAGMLALGAASVSLLAVGTVPWVVAGGLAAFGVGWGWPGLLTFAVARLNPGRTGSATGTILFGGAAGAAAGPLCFGWLVELAGFGVAWLITAAFFAIGAALILIGRWQIIADLRRRDDAWHR